MTLHIFVDANKELIVHTIRGDDKEADRFKKHKQEHQAIHIRIEKGDITIGE
jgi:hypothetical protein